MLVRVLISGVLECEVAAMMRCVVLVLSMLAKSLKRLRSSITIEVAGSVGVLLVNR